MDRKCAEVEDFLRQCKRVLIKSSHSNIVVHKRERGYRYVAADDPSESTVAIVYFYVGPDEVEQQSVRLLVIEGITYTLEALDLPR
jgi:hypothetical protein